MSPTGEVGPWLCVPGFPRVCRYRGTVVPPIDRLALHLSSNTQPQTPTGKSVVGRGADLAQVNQDDQIVHFRSHPDVAGLMMQLGFNP